MRFPSLTFAPRLKKCSGNGRTGQAMGGYTPGVAGRAGQPAANPVGSFDGTSAYIQIDVSSGDPTMYGIPAVANGGISFTDFTIEASI